MIKLLTNPKSKMNFKKIILITILLEDSSKMLLAQNKSIILGRPTDTSITASILFDQSVQFYLQYGTQTGVYTNTTNTINNTVNIPDEVDLHALIPDTKYFYRMQYKVSAGTFTATPEYTFHTQRAPGSTFSFTLESDEHLYDYGNTNLYKVTLANEASENPDFMMTLGDIFGDDHHPTTITSQTLDSLHQAYRPLLGAICPSVPFFDCLGNHEGEKKYYITQTPPNNMGIYATLARKKYYPNPIPNAFYSGNDSIEQFGVGEPQDYYAFTWGSALFVILDVYRYDTYAYDTTAKPTAWNWTLGKKQYDWLKNTLQNSASQYKFVFCHHLRAEDRGGVSVALRNEWGGYNNQTGTTGSNYQFTAQRPGWAMPIHQLFTTYGVNIFFQGHDHLFAHETLNNVVYQEVPMAADSTYKKGMLANGAAYTADTLAGSGHLKVTVTPQCVTVDYVNSYLWHDTASTGPHNKNIAFSYTLGSCVTTGINNNTEQENVSIFPNPTKDNLIVKLGDDIQHFQINIDDILDQTVVQSFSKIIDVSSLPNGVYFVHIITEKYETNRKIIINH